MNSTVGALTRFWWLVVAGIAAGALAAIAIYSLQSQAKHTATTRVFVSSPSAPYLRTTQSQAQTLRRFASKVVLSFDADGAGQNAAAKSGDLLVALIRFNVVSVAGDVPLDHVWGYVCEARDGRLVRLRAYWDPDEALAAAGVDSP